MFYQNEDLTVMKLDDKETQKFVRLSCLGTVSLKLSCSLRTFGSRPAFHLLSTTKKLFSKLKDPIPSDEKSGGVYQIRCNDWSALYVGQTRRKLKTRISEHHNAMKKTTILNPGSQPISSTLDIRSARML